MEVIDSRLETHPEITADFLRTELSAAFLRVWETTLSSPIELVTSDISDTLIFPWLGAVAWIGGSWTGNVRIGVPKVLACIIAGRVLDTGIPLEEHINDSLRELANMIAGNLKSVLPGRCGLATPGSFEISSLANVQDEFSPIVVNWYRSWDMPLFLALSGLHQS